MLEREIKIILSRKEIDKRHLWLKPRLDCCGYDLLYFGCQGWTPLICDSNKPFSLCGDKTCNNHKEDFTCEDQLNTHCGEIESTEHCPEEDLDDLNNLCEE